MTTIRSIVRERATQAGLQDPDGFARSFHMLMKGSIITAAEGDTAAAVRAQRTAQLLIAAHSR